MRNRGVTIFTLTLLVALSLSPVFAGGSQEAEAEGGASELVIGVSAEIEGTDVQQVFWEDVVHELLYDRLVYFNLTNDALVPAMATGYEIADNDKDITFFFDDTYTFTNGDPLTLEAMKASIERYQAVSPYAGDIAPVQEVVVQDDGSLLLVCSDPAPFMWPTLASVYGGMVNAAYAEEVGAETFNREAVAYGLTSVDEWVQGSHILLKTNPDYTTNNPLVTNKGPLSVDRVRVRFISDDFTRLSELESGNVDIVYDLPPESIEQVRSNPDIEVIEYLDPGVQYLYVNTEADGLSDFAVRLAMTKAIDREAMATFLSDTVQPINGIISPAMIGFSSEAEDEFAELYGYDPEEAMSILDEAGWVDSNGDGVRDKDGEELSFTLLAALDFGTLKRAAPVFQQQMAAIGVAIEIREFEEKYVKQAVADKDFDLATMVYTWIDPDVISYLFHSEMGYGYADPEVDALLDEARYIVDPAERTEAYADFQRALLDDVPIFPLFVPRKYIGHREAVDGLHVSASGGVIYNDVVINE